jgi:hypothetical protein
MTKRYLVIATAWLLHTASWFLPAIKGFLGDRLDHGIPGWDVFLSQTCVLLPCGDASADPWYGTPISAAGVVTTRFVCARLTVDCVASITYTSPCGSIRRSRCFHRELSVVRVLRTS